MVDGYSSTQLQLLAFINNSYNIRRKPEYQSIRSESSEASRSGCCVEPIAVGSVVRAFGLRSKIDDEHAMTGESSECFPEVRDVLLSDEVFSCPELRPEQADEPGCMCVMCRRERGTVGIARV